MGNLIKLNTDDISNININLNSFQEISSIQE